MGTFAGRNFEVNLSFSNFHNQGDFFDVTLAADDTNGSMEVLRAHKVILSAASPVLRLLLREQYRLSGSSQMMPLMLYLRGISAKGLSHVLDFVYNGSISLAGEDLEDFLAVSESLQISFVERSSHGPRKRALASSHIKKEKRAKFVPQAEQGLTESDPSNFLDECPDEITIKPDLGISQVYEEVHEEDIKSDLYEENIDLEDSKQEILDESKDDPDFKLDIKLKHAKNVKNSDGERGKRNVKEYRIAEVLEGKKKGSVNYLIQNKLLMLNRIYKNTIIAACNQKKKGCRGRAILCKDTLMVLNETAHTCDTDETSIAILNLENKMKNMAESERSLSFRQIFDEVASENPKSPPRSAFRGWRVS